MRSLVIILVCLATSLGSQNAFGFAILIDQTLAFCDEDFSSGGVELQIGRYNFEGGTDTSAACTDPGKLDPFSVNVGGTFYTSLFLNNDGLVTFGGAHNPAITSVVDPLMGPALAPAFRNSPYEPIGRISWGGTAFGAAEYLSLNYAQNGSYYQMNLFNRDDIAVGDFDVQINYTFQDAPVDLGAGPVEIGFNNGAGQSYLLPGSNMPGAFNNGGVNDCPAASALALACSSLGSTAAGRYVFEFRSGSVTNINPTNPTPVSEPATAAMLFVGLGVLALRRRRQIG
ncbi:MAG: PEP-CTERM sorting domain-containing protein [Pseudomonadota bacterium]